METPMASEEGLTQEQLDHFAKRLAARKQQLLDEIHEALRREGADERYDRIVGAAGDTADEAESHRRLQTLMKELEVDPATSIAGSYADLLMGATQATR